MPENKREGQLIKELEEILSREGLSSNPSEKGELVFLSDTSSMLIAVKNVLFCQIGAVVLSYA